ncbi:MAG TPA: acid-shock protein [Paraburkholderia sp.]|jgi:hypothetical protein
MKKLVLTLAAAGVAALAQPSFAQPAAASDSHAVSSYSVPTEKHVKKPKTAKKHRWRKKAASAPAANE